MPPVPKILRRIIVSLALLLARTDKHHTVRLVHTKLLHEERRISSTPPSYDDPIMLPSSFEKCIMNKNNQNLYEFRTIRESCLDGALLAPLWLSIS